MASRYDNLIKFDKLSEKQATWAHNILTEAQAIIDAAVEECRNKMKAEKRHLMIGIAEEIDDKVADLFADRISRYPWELFDECKDGRGLAWRVGAVDYLDICKNYLGPKLRKDQGVES